MGLRQSRRRGMIAGAAIASSRANKQQAAQAPAPSAGVPADETTGTPSLDIEQLKQLAELRDQGILTDAEFDAKKKQILGL